MDPQDSHEAFHQQIPNYAGWASFEARVRGRRFARVVEMARNAIDHGRLEDARSALQEARTLVADAPEIAELEQRLEQRVEAPPLDVGELLLRHEPPEVDVESDPGWLRLVAGMAVVVLLIALVGFGLVQVMRTSTARQLLTARSSTATTDVMQTDTPPTKPATDPTKEIQKVESAMTSPQVAGASTAAPGTQPQPSGAVATEPEPVPAPAVTPPVAPRRPLEASIGLGDIAPRPTEARRLATPPQTQTQTPTMGMRLRSPSWATSSPEATSAPAPASPAPAPPPAAVTSATETDTSTRAAAVAPSVPSPAVNTAAHAETSASVTPVPSLVDVPVRASHQTAPAGAHEEDSTTIRALLSRYESAYNRLDAKAASSVWPGVNQAALGRAFDGLLSQRVSLGLCDITVIGDIAGAYCAGKARWEPKVGGGLQTADRYWKFNLRKTDDGWKIQEILVR